MAGGGETATRQRRISTALVLLTVVLLGISLINAPFPRVQYLQHAPTVIALVMLLVASRRSWWSPASLACLIAFCWLHILGARYAYSNVPYDAWSRSLWDTSISEVFAWERNHYDRLVHFAFGLLFVLPITEIARGRRRMPRGWALAFATTAVMAISALYEVFEWLLTMFVAPSQAKSYNGQQGDPWDAQKDMALAGLGAILAVPIAAWWTSRGRER